MIMKQTSVALSTTKIKNSNCATTDLASLSLSGSLMVSYQIGAFIKIYTCMINESQSL